LRPCSLEAPDETVRGHFLGTLVLEQIPHKSSGKVIFFVGDVAIHVTASPSEAVIERCRENLNDGHRPLLVTRLRGLTVVEDLTENMGLADGIDVFEIEQFVDSQLRDARSLLLSS
jgi:hypothetical protein